MSKEIEMENWGKLDYSVGKIVFYNNGNEIEISTNQYLSDSYRINENGVAVQNYFERLAIIKTEKEFKKANKKNLSRKDNYYMTYKPDYSSEKRYALYIHADFEISEVIDHIWEKETAYIKWVSVKLPAVYTIVEREELPYDPHFTLPDGARWMKFGDTNNTYSIREAAESKITGETFEAAILHFTERQENRDKMFFRVGPYTRIEYSEAEQKKRALFARIEELTGRHVSHYDLEKILEHFDIIEKK